MPRPANDLQYELAYKYFDGHLQLECPEITLRSPSELVAKGVGVFRSCESGQLQLDAQVNVDAEYMREYATGGRVGALMPIEKTMVAEGEMEGSLRFHTGVLDISSIVFMGVSPQEYRPDYVTISGFQSCFLELTLYRKLRRNPNWFYPPILHHSDREPEVELTIIRKLFKYLLNDSSGKLKSVLEVYNSISYSPVVSTHALLLATLIEGLLKLMEDDVNPTAKSKFDRAKRVVLDVLNEMSVCSIRIHSFA